MAPSRDHYFPPLEQCLSGEFLLPAWSDVYSHLIEDPSPPDVPWLFDLLRDANAIDLLANATHGFPAASAKSRAAFETKTAAINITPSRRGQYDIHEIKGDALWLSDEAKIDEDTALRIVILEWQYQPLSKLRYGFSEAEKASVREAFGAHFGAQNQSIIARTSDRLQDLLSQEYNVKDFFTAESRRIRILDLYLLERCSLLNTARLLFLAAYSNSALQERFDVPDERKSQHHGHASIQEELGQRLIDIQEQRFQKAQSIPNKSEQVNLPKPQTAKERIFIDHIDSLVTRYRNIIDGSGWFKDEGRREDVEIAWTENNFKEMVVLMELMFLQAQSWNVLPTSAVMLNWLHFLADKSFFERTEATSPSILDALTALRQLSPLVTLAILNIGESIEFIAQSANTPQDRFSSDEHILFLDHQCIGQVHEVLMNAAFNRFEVTSISVLAWAIVCLTIQDAARRGQEARETAVDQRPYETRRNSGSSAASIQKSVFEDTVDAFRQFSGNEEYVDFLLGAALEQNSAFGEMVALAVQNSGSSIDERWKRLCLQDLARSAFGYISDDPGVLPALLSTLHEVHDDKQVYGSYSDTLYDPRANFINDQFLLTNVLEEMLLHFPYRIVNFLKLCRLLGSSDIYDDDTPYTLNQLKSMTTFSCALSPAFQGYQTVREDENSNEIQLIESWHMYGLRPTKAIGFRRGAPNTDVVEDSIQSGTVGHVISNSRPLVVCFNARYSGLAYLGKLLSLMQSGKITDDQLQEHPDTIKAEIISLFATFLARAERCKQSTKNSQAIIEEASSWLEGHLDIVNVVTEVFEQELINTKLRSIAERSLDILTSCLSFLQSIIKVLPGRIWQVMAHSSFLGCEGGGAVLLSLISRTTELASADSRFLEQCIKIFSGLVEDVLARSISKQPQSNNRFEAEAPGQIPTPLHTMEKVLISMTQALCQIYESMMLWTSRDPQQRETIGKGLVQIFRNIIYYAYGIDDRQSKSKRALASLTSSASYLLESLTLSRTSDGIVNPVIISLGRCLDTANPTMDPSLTIAWRHQIIDTLSMCLEMLNASAKLKELSTTAFAQQLFNLSPILVRVCAFDDSFKRPVVKLLTHLLKEEGGYTGLESRSLLGQLGSESSASLVELLAYFDRPRNESSLTVDIWDLLTVLVQKNQQWFAVLVLTGSVTSYRPVTTADRIPSFNISIRAKPFLIRALDMVAKMTDEDFDFRVADAVLNFTITAQENWDWVPIRCKSHKGYIDAIRNYPSQLQSRRLRSILERCHWTQLAASVAHALTLYIHQVRVANDAHAAVQLERAITWYSENAPKVDGYNVSQHVSLKRNLTAIYPDCDIEQFKKTSISRREHGASFCYDVDIAEKILGASHAWSGTPGQGLRDEFITANLNLSLVSSQMVLLQSWKALVVEHAAYFAGWNRTYRILEGAVSSCLKANSEDQLPAEQIFDRLFQSRVEIAIALTQGLVTAQAKPSEFTSLLGRTWRSLHRRTANFELAIATNDLEYHRSLLNALLLAVQFHVRTPASRAGKDNQDILNIFLDILTTVVAQGLRGLVAAVHDQDSSRNQDNLVGPADFRLLLALLQSILRVPNLQISGSTQASQALLSTSISQSAILLYSWSHYLLAPNSDPVYAPLSASFLATLSSLPLLAEDLAATHNALSSILTARITRILISRPKGVSPFDNDILSHRLYDTWTRGILPLCLNLLQSVGRAVAAEVIHFLNSFPAQLERASLALDGKAHGSPNFSLSTIKEIQDLALIAAILDRYREAGPSAGVDPLEMMAELRFWTASERKGIREDVDELLLEGMTGSQILRMRVVPMDERERALARKVVGREGGKDVGTGVVVSALEEAARAELRTCRGVLEAAERDD